jgi:putative Ca2+/H+ antiporter (TMEM165/GDT1 family)
MLAARLFRPLPTISGIFFAEIANHALARLVATYFGTLLRASADTNSFVFSPTASSVYGQ